MTNAQKEKSKEKLLDKMGELEAVKKRKKSAMLAFKKEIEDLEDMVYKCYSVLRIEMDPQTHMEFMSDIEGDDEELHGAV